MNMQIYKCLVLAIPFHGDVIKHNIEGVIVPENNTNCAVEAVERLFCAPSLLNELKKGSYESRKRYEIGSYQTIYDEI